MSILALLITGLLERYNLLTFVRLAFNTQVLRYVKFFTTRGVTTQRQIRYIYLFACLPITIILLGIKIIIAPHHFIVYNLIELVFFILGVQVLTWRKEARVASKNYTFIETYAVSFFAALFWYLIIPANIGLMCYIIVATISNEFKNQGLDSVIYNIVVDKILFYANIIPYIVLSLFIAMAGNFEDVVHYLVEQRKNFVKSFFFLENTLREIIFIAIGPDKFKLNDNNYGEATEASELDEEKFNPKINQYVVAILYRSGIFFIFIMAIITLANLLR